MFFLTISNCINIKVSWAQEPSGLIQITKGTSNNTAVLWTSPIKQGLVLGLLVLRINNYSVMDYGDKVWFAVACYVGDFKFAGFHAGYC